MKLSIAQEAVEFYKEEMGLVEGYGVRFLGKVYGTSPVHEGFSLAVVVDQAKDPVALIERDGIPFFIESGDEWFFEDYDLSVEFDKECKEPIYHFLKDGEIQGK
ncbi:iron-sulfur cluster biosynthesis protein [Atopobacter sp. AH10]|uniref:HesB/YadR/YfhF family protein n=1 Tax=Atopobacter sp. AH10 TaxID=2315861 RepID=UPI000EF1B246|nr:iron-sulfur cluster biosynthesis protein [Atopobacter sp. AH10]RLK62881.1 iron-sulfur cluster biosynthesis protein [Atopobacter sp. AH10]